VAADVLPAAVDIGSTAATAAGSAADTGEADEAYGAAVVGHAGMPDVATVEAGASSSTVDIAMQATDAGTHTVEAPAEQEAE
jgi:hypothetical protein